MKLIIETKENNVFTQIEDSKETVTTLSLMIAEIERLKTRLIARLNNIEPMLEMET